MKILKGNRGFTLLLVLLLCLMAVIMPFGTAAAATTAEVIITATPEYIAISDNAASYAFGTVAASSVTNTTTTYIGITNASTVQTDITISTNSSTWTGGVGWTHDDTATVGADTAGLQSQRGGVWGASVVIVKNAAPNNIYEDCPATTNFDYGLSLLAPSSFTDGIEKTITVIITAAAG
jgi:hypothetical protein